MTQGMLVAPVVLAFAHADGLSAEGWKIEGCYVDAGAVGSNQSGRQMRHQVCEVTGMCSELTQKRCSAACFKSGFSLYGVEAGHQCYCDSSLARPNASVSASECDISCTGGSTAVCPNFGLNACAKSESPEHCGGKYRLWVGRTAPEPNPSPTPGPKTCPQLPSLEPAEPRNILNGTLVYESGYLDQPYCQINRRTHEWTCITTAGAIGKREGSAGEQMISQFTRDQGQTWSAPVPIEAHSGGLDNSYGTLSIAASGRLYAMYNMNLDNISTYPNGAKLQRTDEIGHFVMRYSDDGGRTWSTERFEVPYRLTPIDMNNSFLGKTKIMWSVDQVKTVRENDGTTWVIYGFTKSMVYPQNPPQELWFMASDNLHSETDASKIRWRLFPDGDHGILPPGVMHGPPIDQVGDVFEEAHIVPLSQGGFYIMGRTSQGFLGATHTRDNLAAGMPLEGFAPTGYAAYWDVRAARHGQLVAQPTAIPVRGTGGVGYGLKNPRGPITPKRMSNGQYLLLYYNDAGAGYSKSSRNPYWLAAGRESPNHGILWSQPEIVLYNRYEHMQEAGGYPDFIQSEIDGVIYIIETQKNTTRLHRVPDLVLNGLFNQFNATQHTAGAILDLKPGAIAVGPQVPLLFPAIGAWEHERQGFTIDFELPHGTAGLASGEHLLDATFSTAKYKVHEGVLISVGHNGSIVVTVTDSQNNTSALLGCPLQTDPMCSAVLRDTTTAPHNFAIVIDAGPMIASFIVDGIVCDGGHAGPTWATGWFWLPPLNSIQNPPLVQVASHVQRGFMYSRALTHSEVLSNHRARMA